MTISVIIPVYNVGELLRESVDSIISQLGDDCEVIIVDDGSTDNSGRLCDEYSGTKNVQVVHKTNGGLSSARNAGIDHASGQYLLFLDSDDYLRPGSLSLLRGMAERHGDFDFIQFRYDEVSDYSDRRPESTPADLFVLTDRRKMFEQKFALGGIGASGCTKLIHRRVFDSLRFKEGIIHEDEQFTIHLIANSHRALYISNPLYMYVQRPGSIITSKFSRKRLDIIPVLEEQMEVLRANGYDDLADLVRDKLFTSLCMMYVDARSSAMYQCADIIKYYAKTIVRDVNIKSGTIGIIAAGMKMHLPMLQLYYLAAKKRHGKA